MKRDSEINKLKVYFLSIFLAFSVNVTAQNVSFSASGLANESVNNPTSLDFGPDGRLYVAQQNGAIIALEIVRDGGAGEGSYSAVSSETISIVQTNTPNHTDDGIATTIELRQVTGILTAGTPLNPVLYVTSSDNLIGGGGGINDKNLDTNSGIISKITWNGTAWTKVDLVRGLPRSEENHSTNGMDLFERGGQTYMLVQQGGHANKGAPSNNFVGTPEYFLSAALLIVNLTQIESMPVYIDPRSGTQYVYDLPTLNDPERDDITNTDPRFPYPDGHPLYLAAIDVGDPFGGNDSLNQAFAETNGPVQIFSPGYRNAFDVIVTETGRIFTSDNGPNGGWGGLPVIYDVNGDIKGSQDTVSYQPENGDYIANDFNEGGSNGHGDALHFVGITDDTNGTYYGGHPNPILAFPSRASLINYKNFAGVWTETVRYSLGSILDGSSGYFNESFSIADFPDDPRLGNYLADASINSEEVNILDIVNSSTNGITEYTASNFNGALQGSILTASFNGNINRYVVDVAGELVSKEVIFNGFGAIPLDVIALPDNHPFGGTIWAATYGADNITIFEPSDLGECVGVGDVNFDPQADSDGDGYTNQDEIDNGTNLCSGGSTPRDNDADFISDLNDTDDDNDGLTDLLDAFALDPANGTTTNLPINYSFFNNDPGTGLFGLGFTGLMLDPSGATDYLSQFDENNMSFGGAAGKASVDLIPAGDALAATNTQQYGFMLGVNVDSTSPTFTVHSRIESPFFGVDGDSSDPLANQSTGIFIGNGDQDNYLKIVLGYGTVEGDGIDGIEVLLEEAGEIAVNERFDIPNLLSGNAVDIFISVFPGSSQAQVYISLDGGSNLIALGGPILLPQNFLDPSDAAGMAVGLIATSEGASAVPFASAWDFINITEDQPGVLATSLGDAPLDFGAQSLDAGIALLNLAITNLSGAADDPLTISSIDIVGDDAALFSALLSVPLVLGPGGELVIPVSFSGSGIAGVKNASLQIYHSGDDSPFIIQLTAMVEAQSAALIRINAAGPLVSASDGGPDWLADPKSGSPTLFSINTGRTAGFAFLYASKDDSIPDYIDASTYTSLFGSERWDSASGAEMMYSIPLANGEYLVNLYVGNGYSGTAAPATRVYDIVIEGVTAINDLDLAEAFGHKVGGVVSYSATVDDGVLNIEFGHVVENPLVNAIEIFAQSSTVQNLFVEAIDNRADEVSTPVDFAVVAGGGNASVNLNYSLSGQPDGIQIEPTNGQIFGTVLEAALVGGIAHDGVHTVTVSVSQAGLSSTSQEFQWIVTPKALLSWIDKDENENYVARHESSFVQAGDTFIMFGGRESSQRLDVYDYTNDTWSLGGEAPFEFNHFQAITYQGLVWVIGAFQDNSFPNETPATHIYMYNPATQQWIQGAAIPEARRRGGAGLVLHNDIFYLVGGNTSGHNGGYVPWFDSYNPVTGIWTVLADAPHARDHFHATIADGQLFAVSGRLSGGDGGTFAPLVAEIDVYDFVAESWSSLSAQQNLPTPRAAPGIATFNDKIFVMGGEDEVAGPAFDIVEIYDPIDGTWTDGPPMNHGRHGTQVIASGEGLFIAGGSPNQGSGNQKNMEVLGEDNPQGQAIVDGFLLVDQDSIDFEYRLLDGRVELEFNLLNFGGDTGAYINSIEISGNNFVLLGNYSERLIRAQEELNVLLELADTQAETSTGLVTVNYNGGASVTLALSGLQDTSVFSTSVGDAPLDFGAQPSDAGISLLNLAITNLSGPAEDPLTISSIDIVGDDAALFSALLSVPLVLDPGDELVIPMSFSGSGIAGVKNASLQIYHSGDDSPFIIQLTAMVEAQSAALMRINAAGPLVSASDGGPDWLADPKSGSPTLFSINTGRTAGFAFLYASKDDSIPDYIDASTYTSLFGSERWDSASGAEMMYSIPLANGEYLVNLYVGNGYSGTAAPATRVYDIVIEGVTAINDLDLAEAFGHKVGGVVSYSATVDDGVLNIEFGHVVENPLVNAIEIFAQSSTVQNLFVEAIDNRADEVSTPVDFAVVAGGGNASVNLNYSLSGQPDGIQIEPTNGQIFGTVLEAALVGGIAHDGVHTVTVSVSQAGLSSTSQEFQWIVTPKALLSWIDKDENENYVARHESSFVQAGDTFIMFGGRESSQRLDVYDYTNDTWSLGGEAPFEFNHFQAITYQGLVWVIGAFQDNSFPNETPATHIYMYNPATQQWIQGAAIPEARRRGGAGLVLHNDIFYLVGGNTSGHNGGYVPWFDSYNPVTGIWTVLADAPHARDHFHATIADGQLFAVSGRLSGGDGGTFAPLVAEIDVYDFVAESWSSLSAQQNLPTPRAAPGIATFNDKIFVMGGEDEVAGPAFDIVEIYDPIDGTWTDGPPMNHGRHGTQVIASGEGLFIAGGSPNQGSGNQKNMEVLGEDNPQGQAIVDGFLLVDQDSIDFEYRLLDGRVELEFNLLNFGGDTGAYINSIEISGNNFVLLGNYSERLIRAQEELNVLLELADTQAETSTGLVTVNYNGGASVTLALNGLLGATETVVYRVNAGGQAIADPLIGTWTSDLRASPSSYVNADDYNRTYTKVRSGFINSTIYDSSLFYSTRYNVLSAPENMQWDFPVENGSYIINLLFAEIWTGAQAAGVRVFDVAIEDVIELDDYDITARLGWNTAGSESFSVEVDDGNIDIDFLQQLENPQINAIEVIRVN